MSDVILQSKNLYKAYHDGNTKVSVLNAVDFEVKQSDKIAITGPSGSGKSTLLHLLGGLDIPSAGYTSIFGQQWQKISEKKRCRLRNQHLGFIYQFHHLLPEFSAVENVSMPLLLADKSIEEAKAAAIHILNEVGLSERLEHKPSELSGGERQRVAIARALVHQPDCVLADEPTGNLDQQTAAKVFELMLEINEKRNTALIIVTHDQALAQKMDIQLSLHEGKLTNTPPRSA